SEGLPQTGESAHGMGPAVSRVLDELLKQAESGDLAGGAQVLDPAGEPRDVAEAGPAREKVQDFQLWIGAALRPSDRLQDQPPVEDVRCIALLSSAATRRRRSRTSGVRTAQSSTSTESMRCVLAANQRWPARKSLRRSRPCPSRRSTTASGSESDFFDAIEDLLLPRGLETEPVIAV